MAEKNTTSTTSIKFNGKFLLILLLIVFGGGFMAAVSFANDNKSSLVNNDYVLATNVDMTDREGRVILSDSSISIEPGSYLFYQPIAYSGVDFIDSFDLNNYITFWFNRYPFNYSVDFYNFLKTSYIKIPENVGTTLNMLSYDLSASIKASFPNFKILYNLGIVSSDNQVIIFDDNNTNKLKFSFTNVNDMKNIGNLILNENNVSNIFNSIDFVNTLQDGLNSIFNFVGGVKDTTTDLIKRGFTMDLGKFFRSIDFRFSNWFNWLN